MTRFAIYFADCQWQWKLSQVRVRFNHIDNVNTKLHFYPTICFNFNIKNWAYFTLWNTKRTCKCWYVCTIRLPRIVLYMYTFFFKPRTVKPCYTATLYFCGTRITHLNCLVCSARWLQWRDETLIEVWCKILWYINDSKRWNG